MAKWGAAIPGGFTDLLRRLGIAVPIGANIGFDLTGNVIPVAIVDPAPLTIVSVPPSYPAPFTAGPILNPGAAVRMADTGAQSALRVSLKILITAGVNVGIFRIKRRNAADAADIWSHDTNVTINSTATYDVAVDLASGERVVVETIGALVGTFQASIFLDVLS